MAPFGDDYYSLNRQFHRIIYFSSQIPFLCTIVDKLIESVETFLTRCKPIERSLSKSTWKSSTP